MDLLVRGSALETFTVFQTIPLGCHSPTLLPDQMYAFVSHEDDLLLVLRSRCTCRCPVGGKWCGHPLQVKLRIPLLCSCADALASRYSRPCAKLPTNMQMSRTQTFLMSQNSTDNLISSIEQVRDVSSESDLHPDTFTFSRMFVFAEQVRLCLFSGV